MNIKNQLFWVVAVIGLILDQVTKFWAIQTIELEESIPLLGSLLALTHIKNEGAAYGSLSELGGEWLRWVSLIASLGLMALASLGPPMSRSEQIGWGCILAGAMGNGVDRFLHGHVTDFIQFSFTDFPLFNFVFNIADVFISLGVVSLLISAFRTPPRSNGNSKRSQS